MNIKITVAIAMGLLVSACSSSGPQFTSAFQEPKASGYIDAPTDTFFADYRVGGDAGYAVFIGANLKDNDPNNLVLDNLEDVVAYAGLGPNASVVPNQTGGKATYDTYVLIDAVQGIDLANGNIGYYTEFGGELTIAANFDTGILNGQVSNLPGEFTFDGEATTARLVVRGTITQDEFTGEVQFRPEFAGQDTGQLIGLIGDDAIIGAFHGNAGDLIYAGGFIGDAK